MALADVNTNDASFTISSLSANTLSMNFTVQNVVGGTGRLIFDNNGSAASLAAGKNSGKYCRINVAVVLNDTLNVKGMGTSGGLSLNREISSGVGKTTGLTVIPQDSPGSNQSTGDVLLNAAASYTGETWIRGSATLSPSTTADGSGRLMLGLDNALPITTVLQVGGATINRYPRGGVLKLNGKNQEVAGLYGAAGYDPGKITSTNAATLTINNATDYDFAGSIGGETPTPVSVTKKGLGVQTFSGTNTYTGNTTVEAGTLVLAPPGELRFVIQNANVANQVTGAGAANLNGLLRLDVSAVTDTKGTWNLVDTTTLAASFGGSFGVAFEGGPAFTDRGGGIYTGNGGWTFTAASGSLTLSSPVLATVIAVR
jgi:autotransporter-associated beta strand protein